LAIIFSALRLFNASVKVMLKVQKDLAIWEKIRTFEVGETAKEDSEAVTAVPPTTT
jgi:hypothetical protein